MSIACPSLIGSHYPNLCAAVDHYCERTNSALDAEPINALTNAGFLIAAWGAWLLYLRHPAASARVLIRILISIIVTVGLGSFLFHTVATRWAEWGDVLPIMLFMLLYLWLVLTVFFGLPAWLKVSVLVMYFAATFYLESRFPAQYCGVARSICRHFCSWVRSLRHFTGADRPRPVRYLSPPSCSCCRSLHGPSMRRSARFCRSARTSCGTC